jgi:tRNA G18 (ribose-2'-O)-methylase SpoU
VSFDAFYNGMPYDCRLVGVEFPHDGARPLLQFVHPERCVYLLGAEDRGLSKAALARCQSIVYIPSKMCLNVAVAGSVIIYDRIVK